MTSARAAAAAFALCAFLVIGMLDAGASPRTVSSSEVALAGLRLPGASAYLHQDESPLPRVRTGTPAAAPTLTPATAPPPAKPAAKAPARVAKAPTKPAAKAAAAPIVGPVTATAAPRAARGSKGPLYLTFDDGPSPTATAGILAVLRAHDAQATFFVMGSRADDHRDLLAAIRAGGHAVGNHTWSHPDLIRRPSAAIASEISRTRGVIGAAPCFRAPYGSTNSRVERAIKAAGLTHYLWSVDTKDWTRPTAATITSRVLTQAHKGSVVLLHDGGGDRSRTVTAVAQIVPALVAAGYDLRALPGC